MELDKEKLKNLNLLLKLNEAKNLLAKSVRFMNKVPNNKYGENYYLCSKIDEFLKKE